MTLHTINLEPSSPNIRACFAQTNIGDSIIFLDKGLDIALESSPYREEIRKLQQEKNILFYFLQTESNQLSDNNISFISAIDYTKFVQLTIEHSNTVSWY